MCAVDSCCRSLFTKIINGQIPSAKVAEGEGWYAFLDINPRRPGHTLVVPKEERQRIAELTPASRAAIMEGIAESQRKLTAVFNTPDFQVSVHDGPTAGQEGAQAVASHVWCWHGPCAFSRLFAPV